MRIAFDAKRLFNNHTGLGNYSRTLVSNYKRFYPEDELTLFATDISKSNYYSDYADDDIILPGIVPKALWRSYTIANQINKLRPDIYHGLSNEIPFSAPKISAAKIVTIHDLFFLKYPHDFSKVDRWLYKKKTTYSCEKADHIIAISDATKSDLINYLKIKEEKITTVYQSCATLFQEQSESSSDVDLPPRYFLYVGTLNKRKNITSILQAIARIPREKRIPLLVVGQATQAYRKVISNLIEELKIREDVIFLGHVANNSLKVIYQNAVCTVLPSFYEGFGIPVIESLFCGTPVIVSDVSALPEAAGPCGLHLSPTDVEQMASGLTQFISDDQFRNQLLANVKVHLEQFSSSATAKKLHSIYSLFS